MLDGIKDIGSDGREFRVLLSVIIQNVAAIGMTPPCDDSVAYVAIPVALRLPRKPSGQKLWDL